MPYHHFISYSSADAKDFALRLGDALAAGPPSIPVWLDKRELKAGADWDEQIAEAIRACESLVFVMTRDSVEANSVCKQEWTRALKYKKPIVPIRLHADAEMPFRLEPRQFIDFTGSFDTAIAKLRIHLQWLASPAGVLQALKDRLADAKRELRRAADTTQQARIQDDIAQLEKQIVEQQRLVDDPQGTAQRVAASIAAGLEREREPDKPIGGAARSKFINPPPAIAPNYFQDRFVETKLLADFLKDQSRQLMTVVGRGGVGKTAMVCRLLKALETGQLPDDLGPFPVNGIVYLSATGSRRINVPNLYADLLQLLPSETAKHLDTLYKNPQVRTEAKMRELLAAIPKGRVVLLLDNFEDVVDPETRNLRDSELDEALRVLLILPPHAVKVIITTRIAPWALSLVQPARQMRLDLDDGLESPYAENILREMDVDGKVGLKSAPEDLLAEARSRTLGYPRALEALFAILSADRDTTLRDLLHDAERLLPENVVEALVGEAFARLDSASEKVMQALAIYNRPVTPTAVDYLLRPYLPGGNSGPVLNRLVNMHFARKEAGRYYLHPVDRDYAFECIPKGEVSNRNAETPPFTQFALWHRGAEYFKQARKPSESWKAIEDLAPHLAEFDLRFAGQDYDTAAQVLKDVDEYLLLWGFYRLVADLHEKIKGELCDPELKQMNLNRLGHAYSSMGHYRQAINYYGQVLALVHEIENRFGEQTAFYDLAWCYNELGQTTEAINYSEQALAIARELGNRVGEADNLSILGWYHGKLGHTSRAIDYCKQALTIIRETDDPIGEGTALSNLAGVLIDEGQYEEAIQYSRQSIKIGDELHTPRLGNWSNGFLALAYLYSGDLPAARAAAEIARQYDEPENNQNVLALLGLIALQQGDIATAQVAFVTAVQKANALLANSVQNYNALDTKGLVLAGLALCEDSHHVPAAIEAYRAARAINKDAGIIKRVLRLFDVLAKADAHGVLAEVRAAAAGGK